VERLAGRNELRLFDALHRNALTGTGLEALPTVELIQGDVLDRAAVDRAIKGCNAVIHLAAIAGVDTVMRIPVQTMRVSLLGTANLLEAAAEQPDMRRFIDFSTSEVFGNPRSTVTIFNLAREVVRLSSSGSSIEHVEWNFPDVELRIPNIDKARDLLGFEPQVDLEEGLLRTISWYRKRLRG
jgi:nucleoside-diphosphate-sugar epimerase